MLRSLALWLGVIASLIAIQSFARSFFAEQPLAGLGVVVRHGPLEGDRASRVSSALVQAGAQVAHVSLVESLPSGLWILCRGMESGVREAHIQAVLRQASLDSPNRLDATPAQRAKVSTDCEVWID